MGNQQRTNFDLMKYCQGTSATNTERKIVFVARKEIRVIKLVDVHLFIMVKEIFVQ